MEQLADDHSSVSDDAPTGVEESAAPAAPAVAGAPERGATSLLERLQAIRIIYGSTIMTALCLCVVRKMSSASPARACPRLLLPCPSILPVPVLCPFVFTFFHRFHRLHSE